MCSSDLHYGERCIVYLTKNPLAVRAYKLAFIGCTYIGAVSAVNAVWLISDIFCALMLFPNLYMLMRLHPQGMPCADGNGGLTDTQSRSPRLRR